MADDNEDQVQTPKQSVSTTFDSLMATAKGTITKGKREALTKALVDIVRKIEEAKKTIKLLELEANKLVDDFNNGI